MNQELSVLCSAQYTNPQLKSHIGDPKLACIMQLHIELVPLIQRIRCFTQYQPPPGLFTSHQWCSRAHHNAAGGLVCVLVHAPVVVIQDEEGVVGLLVAASGIGEGNALAALVHAHHPELHRDRIARPLLELRQRQCL